MTPNQGDNKNTLILVINVRVFITLDRARDRVHWNTSI